MTSIERRITELEKTTGVSEEAQFICVKDYHNGNPECPAFKDSSKCSRFHEFYKRPQVNENGFAVFCLKCEECEGV